jgi:hypothetical protein
MTERTRSLPAIATGLKGLGISQPLHQTKRTRSLPAIFSPSHYSFIRLYVSLPNIPKKQYSNHQHSTILTQNDQDAVRCSPVVLSNRHAGEELCPVEFYLSGMQTDDSTQVAKRVPNRFRSPSLLKSPKARSNCECDQFRLFESSPLSHLGPLKLYLHFIHSNDTSVSDEPHDLVVPGRHQLGIHTWVPWQIHTLICLRQRLVASNHILRNFLIRGP